MSIVFSKRAQPDFEESPAANAFRLRGSGAIPPTSLRLGSRCPRTTGQLVSFSRPGWPSQSEIWGMYWPAESEASGEFSAFLKTAQSRVRRRRKRGQAMVNRLLLSSPSSPVNSRTHQNRCRCITVRLRGRSVRFTGFLEDLQPLFRGRVRWPGRLEEPEFASPPLILARIFHPPFG